MTANQTIQFLVLLAQADAVALGGPTLTDWDTSAPTGDSDNEVVRFQWEDQEGVYNVNLTEGAIAAGQWVGESFFCNDHEGDGVQISLYKHAALTPTTVHHQPN